MTPSVFLVLINLNLIKHYMQLILIWNYIIIKNLFFLSFGIAMGVPSVN